MAHTLPAAKRRPPRTQGWIPAQHGAWAMLVVPFVAGLVMASRARPLVAADWLLGLTWLIGYFAFNALTLTIKAAPARRARYRGALATWSALAAIAGLATLWVAGWEIVWWMPLYVVLLGWTLRLVANKQERSLTSGTLTVLASCGLMLVLRFGTPQHLLAAPSPATLADLATIVAITGYFCGTIWHVKALIRERNDPESAKRSAAVHAGLAVIVVGFAFVGWLGWGWAVFALALLVRATWLPRNAAALGWRPREIGLVEVGVSCLLVALVSLHG